MLREKVFKKIMEFRKTPKRQKQWDGCVFDLLSN